MNMTDLSSIERSIRRYRLRIVSRDSDDGAFRSYTLARAGSGSRGGHMRNVRHITVTAEQDIDLRQRGLLREAR